MHIEELKWGVLLLRQIHVLTLILELIIKKDPKFKVDYHGSL